MLNTKERMKELSTIKQEKAKAGLSKKPEHNLVLRAQADPNSKVKAIHAMCFQCFGGSAEEMPDPGWRKMVATCTAPDCAIYPHRKKSRS